MNLATEFNVNERTIRRDIEIISLSYPLKTVQGNGGGIYVEDWFQLGKTYLSDKQAALLEELASTLDGEKLKTLQSIIKQFFKTKTMR